MRRRLGGLEKGMGSTQRKRELEEVYFVLNDKTLEYI
jgi:hypothetical protein